MGVSGEHFSNRDWLKSCQRSEPETQIVERAGELVLEIPGKNCVCDGPRNDPKMRRPRTGRHHAIVGLLKFAKPAGEIIAVLVLPKRRVFLERLPIFSTGVVIALLGRVDDPG